jgi:catechol 2,3-dioxygenase
MSVTAAPTLPATLGLGPVEITVADLDRSLEFYERSLGLHLHSRDDGRAELGDGDQTSVILTLDPQARPAGRHAGLYHYALLFESREELANVALRVAESRSPIDGATDHETHEAIYLPDPDGNGIELAWDRPREQWPAELYGQRFGQGPQPLDIQDLLSLVGDQQPRRSAGEAVKIGHVHLHVGDLDKSIAFYVDTLGFDLRAAFDGVAAFVSAGGYHHHLAFNLWRGRNTERAPDPATVAGLRHWTIELDSSADLDAVRGRLNAGGYRYEDGANSLLAPDPAGIQVLVTTPVP